jgi:hypothetical protein
MPTPHGSGDWGLTESDLELVHINWNQYHITVLYLRIRNNGPSDFADTVNAVCIGEGILHPGSPCASCPPRDPIDYSGSAWMDIPASHHSMTYDVPMGWALTPEEYDYVILCSIGTPHDPDPTNNYKILEYP